MVAIMKLACAAAAFAQFGNAGRVRMIEIAEAAHDFEAVLEEEKVVNGDDPIDADDAADVMRNLMKKHSGGDVTNLVEALESMINLPRSSAEKKMLTCEKGTLYLWVLTKWRLEAASTTERHALFACEGDEAQDKVCTALDVIAEKCPERANAEELREERASIFEDYLIDDDVAQWHRASQETDSDEEEAEAAEEEEEEVPVAEAPPQATPSYHQPCTDGKRVHVLKAGNSQENKCMPRPTGSAKASCPVSFTTFCYHEDLSARCCCPPNDIKASDRKMGLKTKKYGTAKCSIEMAKLVEQ
eukprot:TRINITY_DN57328_c0_g1_i1.p1 TRINITY_DN57328_c0_g1~~TRINITY_DN57328_c0_g1_i1.p1  ORF type:complete len:325 (-),score=97.58 TRINITY_DN57328_c0_g1_i1:72-974(-)